MRFLVTGGAGFIGSHLVDALVGRGHDVLVIDNLEPQVHQSKPDYLNPGASYCVESILDEATLEESLRGIDVVFHLAAMVGVGQSMYQITRYVNVNVQGTAKLLQMISQRASSVRKVIVASSMSIYGEGAYECSKHGRVTAQIRRRDQLIKRDWEIHCAECNNVCVPIATPETKPLETNSVYAITKRDQEELCLAVGRAYGVPTIALRFFNVFGPRQSLDNPYTGVTAIFQSRIKNGQSPMLFEDGLQSRDFVSVHDVVNALLLSSEKSTADYQAINVGSGTPTSIQRVAEALAKLYHSSATPIVCGKYRAGDVRHCFADIERARRVLGYFPQVPFDRGLRELVEWGTGISAVDRFEDALAELQSRGLVED